MNLTEGMVVHVRPRKFYWDENDKADQEMRSMVNLDRVYTDDSACEFCGTVLSGSAFQCIKCNSLTCASCISEGGSCPACIGSGKADMPEV